MAEGAPDIEIAVEFETDEAQTSSAQFLAALGALQTGTTNMTRAVTAMEAAQRQGTRTTQQAAQATQQAATSATQAATAAINFTQRLQGAASALQSVATAAGSTSGGAGAVARLAATTAQFAQMGMLLGPGGAVIGGIAGFVAGIRGMRQEQEQATVAALAHATALRETADAAADAVRAAGTDEARLSRAEGTAQAARARREATQRRERFEAGAFAPEEAAQAAEYYREQQARLDRTRLHAAEGSTASEILAGSETQYTERLSEAEAAAAGYEETQRRDTNRRGGGGGASRSTKDPNEAMENAEEALARYEEDAARIQEQEEAHYAVLAELAAKRREDEQSAMDAYAEDLSAQADGVRALAEAEKAAFVEREEQLQAQDELDAEISENKKERQRQAIEEYQEVTGTLVDGLVKASEAIADGSASAEDAFKGMLGSFLQYISQRAALEAAAEFAQAIGSFASYNYAAGAQHLAAGALWAGVAVATGVGGAAIARPSAPAQEPARPASSGDRGGSGGNVTTVVNFNQPVMTAQGNAELGRIVNRAAAAGEQRFPGGT